MKNIYVYNNFFKTVININMVVFYITFNKYNDINIYKSWLNNLDWPKEISSLENLNLNLFEVQKLQSHITQIVINIIVIPFVIR